MGLKIQAAARERHCLIAGRQAMMIIKLDSTPLLSHFSDIALKVSGEIKIEGSMYIH